MAYRAVYLPLATDADDARWLILTFNTETGYVGCRLQVLREMNRLRHPGLETRSTWSFEMYGNL
jgi:hypothetical protein